MGVRSDHRSASVVWERQTAELALLNAECDGADDFRRPFGRFAFFESATAFLRIRGRRNFLI
jgi:hypothetical protein